MMPLPIIDSKDLMHSMNLVYYCEECPDALTKRINFEYRNNPQLIHRVFNGFHAITVDDLVHRMINFYKKTGF